MTAKKRKNGAAPQLSGDVKTADAGAETGFVATDFPVVGIGASAGGLAAFEAFFSGMPQGVDPRMAFVVVQHLAPDHKSILTELIRRRTRMQVFEVEDGVVVRPNCVYIIPPNRDMAFLNGTLQLLEPSAPRGHRLPIDFFFQSLARDQHERAICIVLSGTGGDGALGVRAVKNEGGMVMVQSPDSTEFDGMPRSAIATGMVDYQLPPAEMPAQLIAYAARAYDYATRPIASPTPKIENELKKICIIVRAQTGHDFSQYKPSTIYRRIARRMAVQQIGLMDEYVRYLQQTPAEAQALFRDLLIGVTSFFRDTAPFQTLEEQVIPKLFEGKSAGAAVRVWCVGCSTGEEAYSIAILLQEHMDKLQESYNVQVFATDLDSRAIATARAGCYPASGIADMSPQRLARFFVAEDDARIYRIHKSIRDKIVFSEQDVIRDPPFSKLDMISCRNLLIYLSGELQKKLFPVFHYTLNPGGILFLGTSETVAEFADLFVALDHTSKLYRRNDDFEGIHRASIGRLPSPQAAMNAVLPPPAEQTLSRPVKQSLRELTEQMLLHELALSAVLVNGQGDILYIHGRAGAYLEPAPGETATNNVLKMARQGLRFDLAAALHKAAVTKVQVRCSNLRVKTNGHFTAVDLLVCPVASGVRGEHTHAEHALYLVILREATTLDSPNEQVPPLAIAAAQVPVGSEAVQERADDTFDRHAANVKIAALNDELRSHREHLQAANEELETSNEELKSSNEEMQSVNEELQSTNEELETSKEEMQSMNEELTTVNAELQVKVVDLSRASNDLANLLAGTGIGTVFVDHQLRILRFTPAATTIINLIPSDVGRPLAHTVSNLIGYDQLVADAQGVLDTLMPKEVDVQTSQGVWYTMRILPYRTADNVIEGAVVTFVDITEIVGARQALLKSNASLRLAVVVRDAHDAITVQDLTGCTLAWNPGAVRMYGWSEAEALTMNVRDRMPEWLREKSIARDHALRHAQTLEPCLTHRLTKAGNEVEVWLTSTSLVDEAGCMYAIATTERSRDANADGTNEAHIE
ncbi:chemotaxis protein CheB [Paralcaligenes ureilyticus]|uniref:protein-glutamate O-methyltransferase n=1 Tax=Paralcaligenes ureilyticus TaxID=627131 RepID=A0A4R3MDJ6_9BURK|nr:chemotaxis protein CheB [Paralcaligenes ureilyticus]TCT10147.1 two-component system CheB/CheR fusion protein [Paralcaligenes ureilyticus]